MAGDSWWKLQDGLHVPKPGFGAVHEPAMEYIGTSGGHKIYACNWPECDVEEIRS